MRAGRILGALALVSVLAIASTTASAQAAPAPQSASPVPTLRTVFDKAWAQQPEAAASMARRDAALARKSAAQSWTADAPSLEVSARTDRLSRNAGTREYEAGVALPLWLPGERSRSQAVAEAELATVDSRVAAAQWRLAGNVRDAWWSLQLARLDAEVAGARLKSAAVLASDVGRRATAGDLSRADQHQAEAASAAAEAELALAQAAVAQAQSALRAWGVDGMAADPGQAEREPEAASPDTLPTHPALAELSDRVRLAQQQRDLAGVQRRANPELTLMTTRERGGFGEAYGQTVTLGLRFPLGQSGQHRAKTATAQAEQIEAEQQLSLEQQRVKADIAAHAARLSAARVAESAASKRATLARETRTFYEKSFRLGETDLPTRLRVELEAAEADRQSARARIAVGQAISNLRQALGLLPE